MEAAFMAGSKHTINRRQFLQLGSGSVAAMFLPEISLCRDEISKTRPPHVWGINGCPKIRNVGWACHSAKSR
jgi:hypothetical protein